MLQILTIATIHILALNLLLVEKKYAAKMKGAELRLRMNGYSASLIFVSEPIALCTFPVNIGLIKELRIEKFSSSMME